MLTTLGNMTKDGQWRVRMAVFDLIAELGSLFGKDAYHKHLDSIFMGYLTNTAASVRNKGVEKAKKLAKEFKQDWIMT